MKAESNRLSAIELEALNEEQDEYTKSTSKLRNLIKATTGVDILEKDGKTYKDLYDIVLSIGEVWNNLDDLTQSGVAEALAGKRNARGLYSIFSNMDDLRDAYETSLNAAGSATREQEHFAESIQYSIDRAKASIEQLANDFLSSKLLKSIIDVGNGALKVIDSVVSKLGSVKSILLAFTGMSFVKSLIGADSAVGGFVKLLTSAITKDPSVGPEIIKNLHKLFTSEQVGSLGDTLLSKMFRNYNSKAFKGLIDSADDLTEAIATPIEKGFTLGAEGASSAVGEIVGKFATDGTIEAAAETAGNVMAEAAGEAMQEGLGEALQEAGSEVAAEGWAEACGSTYGNVMAEAFSETWGEGVAEVGSEILPEALGSSAAEAGVDAGAEAAAGIATGLSAFGWAAIAAAIAAVVGGAIYLGYKQQQEKIRRELEQGVSQWDADKSKIEEYRTRIRELRDELKDTDLSQEDQSRIKSELLEIQKDIVEQYGEEARTIDLINGDLERQMNILSGIAKAKAEENLRTNREGYEEAKRVMNSRVSATSSGNIILENPEDVEMMNKLMGRLNSIEGVNASIGNYMQGHNGAFGYTPGTLQYTVDIDYQDVYDTVDGLDEIDAEINKLLNNPQIDFNTKTSLNTLRANLFGTDMVSGDFGKNYSNYTQFAAGDRARREQEFSLQGGEEHIGKLEDAVKSYNNAIAEGDPSKIKETQLAFEDTADAFKEWANQKGFTKEYETYFKDLTSTISTTRANLIELQDALSNSTDSNTKKLNESRKEINSMLEEISSAGFTKDDTKFGNVLLDQSRQSIRWTEENLNKYKKEIESWDHLQAEDLANTVTSALAKSNTFNVNGKKFEVAFSPILQGKDGRAQLLDSSTLNKYINQVLSEAMADDGKLDLKEVLEIDTRGIKVDGIEIKNVIGDVGEALKGQASQAENTAKAMNYLGENGKISQKELEAQALEEVVALQKLNEAVKEFNLDSTDIENILIRLKEGLINPRALSEEEQAVYDLAKAYGIIPEKLNEITDESIAEFIDVLSASGTAIEHFDDIVSDSFEEMASDLKSSIRNAIDGIGAINSAIVNNMSGKGLKMEYDEEAKKYISDIDNLNELFAGLEGYDSSKLFEDTAMGVRLNTDELRKLEAQKRNIDKQEFEKKELTMKHELLILNAEMASQNYRDGKKIIDVENEKIKKHKEELEQIGHLKSAYEAEANAYQRWLAAQQAGDPDALYNNIAQTGLTRLDDLVAQNKYNHPEVRAILELLTGKDLSTASVDQLAEAYRNLNQWLGETDYSMREILSDNNNEDLRRFGNELEKLGYLVNEGGKYKLSDALSMDEAASELQMGVETLQAIIDALNTYVTTFTSVKEQLIYEYNATSDRLAKDLNTAITRIDEVNAALVNNKSGKGLSFSYDPVTKKYTGDVINLTNAFKNLKHSVNGFNPATLFYRSATGIRLNTDELRKLQAAERGIMNQKFESQKIKLQRELSALMHEMQITSLNDTAKLTDAEKEHILTLQEKLRNVEMLKASYDGATNAYQRWLDAQSAGDPGDIYENIANNGIKRLDELMSQGKVGHTEVRALLELITGKDLSTAKIDQLIDLYNDLDRTIGQTSITVRDLFDTENGKGVQNFAEVLKSIGYATGGEGQMQLTKWINTEDIAYLTGLSEEFVEANLNAMKTYGAEFTILSKEVADALNFLDPKIDDYMAKINGIAEEKGLSELQIRFDIAELNDTAEIEAEIQHLTEMRDNLLAEGKMQIDSTEYQLFDNLLGTLNNKVSWLKDELPFQILDSSTIDALKQADETLDKLTETYRYASKAGGTVDFKADSSLYEAIDALKKFKPEDLELSLKMHNIDVSPDATTDQIVDAYIKAFEEGTLRTVAEYNESIGEGTESAADNLTKASKTIGETITGAADYLKKKIEEAAKSFADFVTGKSDNPFSKFFTNDSQSGDGNVTTSPKIDTESIRAQTKELEELSKELEAARAKVREAGLDPAQTLVGNIDFRSGRQEIQWTSDLLKDYGTQIQSWGGNAEDLLGKVSSAMVEVEKMPVNGMNFDVAFTPMLQGAGTGGGPAILSKSLMKSYLQAVILEAMNSGEPFSFDAILKIDQQGVDGFEVNGVRIKNMIGAISESLDDGKSQAEKMGEAMYYLGNNGEIEKLVKEMDELGKPVDTKVQISVEGQEHIKELQDYLDKLQDGELINVNDPELLDILSKINSLPDSTKIEVLSEFGIDAGAYNTAEEIAQALANSFNESMNSGAAIVDEKVSSISSTVEQAIQSISGAIEHTSEVAEGSSERLKANAELMSQSLIEASDKMSATAQVVASTIDTASQFSKAYQSSGDSGSSDQSPSSSAATVKVEVDTSEYDDFMQKLANDEGSNHNIDVKATLAVEGQELFDTASASKEYLATDTKGVSAQDVQNITELQTQNTLKMENAKSTTGTSAQNVLNMSEMQNALYLKNSLAGTTTGYIYLNIDGAINALNSLQDRINSMQNQTIYVNGSANSSFATGTALSRFYGNAYAKGNWGTKRTENALVGEVGRELLVDSRNGTWRTIGDHGAEITKIPKGSIIFNHKQTEDILKHGHTNGRGQVEGVAHLSGTAYGYGGWNWSSNNNRTNDNYFPQSENGDTQVADEINNYDYSSPTYNDYSSGSINGDAGYGKQNYSSGGDIAEEIPYHEGGDLPDRVYTKIYQLPAGAVDEFLDPSEARLYAGDDYVPVSNRDYVNNGPKPVSQNIAPDSYISDTTSSIKPITSGGPDEFIDDVTDTVTKTSEKVSKSAEKAFDQIVDWIEIYVDRLDNRLADLAKKADDAFLGYNDRIKASKKYVAVAESKIDDYKAAADAYLNMANNVDISHSEMRRIRNGDLDIEHVKDEEKYDKLMEYKDYYEKYLAALEKVEGLSTAKYEQMQKRFQLTNDLFSQKDEEFQSKMEVVQATIESLRANGEDISEHFEDYQELQQLEKDTIRERARHIKALQKSYKEAIDNGLDETSEAAIQMRSTINSLEAENKKATANITSYWRAWMQQVKEQFDDIDEYYSLKSQVIDNRITAISTTRDISTEMGYKESAVYQKQMMRYEELRKPILEAELERLENMLTNVKKGTKQWYTMLNTIDGVKEEIRQSTLSLLQMQNAIDKIKFQQFEDYIAKIHTNLVDDPQFMIDYMSYFKLFNDNGSYNKLGQATEALHTEKYFALINERDRYNNKVADIEKQLQSNPNDEELLSKKKEYIDLSQQATIAAMNEKKAVQDLVKEGMQIELDNLQKLINKYNESLDNAKNLYDYQKNIAKQTKNIAKLEKQATAFSFDNSEEGQAMRQKISVQLEEAKEQLEDTEYQHYITEQKKILSDMYSKYEQRLNELSDNITALFKDAMARSESNKNQICSTILESLGVDVNPYLENIFKSEETIKSATIHETRAIDKDELEQIHSADDYARTPHDRKEYEGGTGKPPVPEKTETKEDKSKDEDKNKKQDDKTDEVKFEKETIFRATSKVYSDALQNLLNQYQKAINNNQTQMAKQTVSDLTKILNQIIAQGDADKLELDKVKKAYSNIDAAVRSTGIDSTQTKFGNVDLSNRKSIAWTNTNLNKYATQLESWGIKAEDIKGTTTNLMADTHRFDVNGQKVSVTFTPMLEGADGKATLLTKDSVYKYIETILKKATWNGEELNFDKVLKLDAKGLEIEGQKVEGIIAEINNAKQGQQSHAEKLWKALQYIGPDGELGKIKTALEELERIEALKTMAEQLKKLGLEAVDVEKVIKRLKEAGTEAVTATDIKKVTTTPSAKPTTNTPKTPTTKTSTPTVDKSLEEKINNHIDELKKKVAAGSKAAKAYWTDDKIEWYRAYLLRTGGLASGSKKISKNEIAWTQENKPETIVRKSDHAVLTRLGKGDRVYNAAASENMWKAANDPLTYIKDALSDTPVQAGSSAAGTSIGNITYSVNIPIERVQDYNDFVNQMRADGKFEKMIQSMTIDRITGGSKLAKNKYQWS